MNLREGLVDAVLWRLAGWSRTVEFSRRWRWKLEDSGFLSIYSRLIVVCGMARTATTATAVYIATHPDVQLVIGGTEWFRAETDLVTGDIDWQTIDRLLRENRPRMVLIKRPWLERNAEFFQRVTDARVIVCYREKEGLFRSWYNSETAGPNGRKDPQAVYDDQLPFCDRRVEEGALRMDKEFLGEGQARRLAKFLRLNQKGFLLERIRKPWVGLREKEWLLGNSIWLPGRNGHDNNCNIIPGRDTKDDGRVPRGDTTVYES